MKTFKLLVIALTLFLFSFISGDKSEYTLPAYGRTIISVDLDLDGDIDIVSGHIYYWQTEWSGLSILENDSNGYFCFKDSIYIYGGQIAISASNIKGNEYPEIIGQYYNGQMSNAAIVEINNGSYNISYYPMCENLTSFAIGDISGNDIGDIAFISNNDFKWGIIYNDGTGNFSDPDFHSLSFPPIDIACADLNDDDRDDVVIIGDSTYVIFSEETGFHQVGFGAFLPWTGSYNVMLSDFDNDNDKDIIVRTTHVNNQSVVYFFENLGNNEFIEHNFFQFSPFCSYAQIADFNNDFLPDMVFISSDYSGIYIYYNIGEFQLEFNQYIPINNCTQKGLTCNDFDNNGFNDIAIIKDGFPQATLQVLFNNGQGTFVNDPITAINNSEFLTQNISCYPNPFTDITNFKLKTKEKTKMTLSIYNIQGNKVYSFAKKYEKGGIKVITWDGKNMFNTPVGSGNYVAVVSLNGTYYMSVKLFKR